MVLTAEQLRRACPRASMALLPYINASLDLADATTPERVALYLTHTIHETAELQRFVENLNFSAAGLAATWPHRFSTQALADAFAHDPERIANHVYCDRMGNGDEQSGDGFKFRGRGSLPITGFTNYSGARKFLGVDLLAHPELAGRPEYAFKVGAWFWRTHGLNAHADARDLHESTRVLEDLRDTTRMIQGGTTTVAQRQVVLGRVLAALGILAT